MRVKATIKSLKMAKEILKVIKSKNKNKALFEYDKDEELIKAIEEIGR